MTDDGNLSQQETEPSRRFNRQAAVEIENALEAQRENFARELHDEFGQRLTLLKLHTYRLRAHLQESAGAEALNAAVEEIDALIDHVRTMSGTLAPVRLRRFGLEIALRDLVQRYFANTPIRAQLQVQGKPMPLSDQALLGLYRIAQESLTNVVRHAQASQVKLTVTYASDAAFVRLEICDNGVGYRSVDMHAESTGLWGMRMRAEQLGGAFHICSGKEGGTAIVAIVPAAKRGRNEQATDTVGR